MKFAVLLTAMLSGLCAEVMALPVSDLSYPNTVFPDERQSGFVATGMDLRNIDFDGVDFDATIDEKQFISDGSAPVWTPEPPATTTIVIGLTAIGLYALWRRVRRKKRRRRVVRMRAIMAER